MTVNLVVKTSVFPDAKAIVLNTTKDLSLQLQIALIISLRFSRI
jgi:hypothetical protein